MKLSKNHVLGSAAVSCLLLFLLPIATFAATHSRAESTIFCADATPPTGWVITSHSTDASQCGGNVFSGLFKPNIETIAPPPTGPTSVCADSPIPTDFVIMATVSNANCGATQWEAFTKSGKGFLISNLEGAIPSSQLVGYTPTWSGCAAHTTMLSYTSILDGNQQPLGTLLLIRSNDCNMDYSQVVVKNSVAPLISASISHGGLIESNKQMLTNWFVFSPMIPITQTGLTCANGSIMTKNTFQLYTAMTCITLQPNSEVRS